MKYYRPLPATTTTTTMNPDRKCSEIDPHEPTTIATLRQFKDIFVQTDHRESSAQTKPWQPDHQLVTNGDAELLKLDFLKWSMI